LLPVGLPALFKGGKVIGSGGLFHGCLEIGEFGTKRQECAVKRRGGVTISQQGLFTINYARKRVMP
jgi:hypothetical protein